MPTKSFDLFHYFTRFYGKLIYTSMMCCSISPAKVVKHLMKLHIGIRNKSFNSHDWLKRREKDLYVEILKQNNYRCRSAFKLIQIDDRYKLIKPGFRVLDIGAAPGSWSQVLAERTNSNGKDGNNPTGLVIAIDLSIIQSIEGVITLSGMDFIQESSQNKILEILGKDQKFDFVCSDMAPAATGVKNLDQERIVRLIYPVILFSVNHLKVNGSCLVKIWDTGENLKIKNEMQRFFKFFHFVKPKATYTSSSESYLLGRQFVGLKT